jgi:hypothetical protein
MNQRYILGLGALVLAAIAARGRGPVDFAGQVAPLLQARCLDCHGPDKAKGGLRLDRAEGLRQGGNSGAVVRPGQAAASRLLHVVAGTDKDGLVMPPRGRPRLTDPEVALLRAWIDQGAHWPDGLTLAAPKGPAARHWAFRPLRSPPLPAIRHLQWARNPIDRFVLARLEREGIAPAPEADPATLARRVTLDLTGLPPEPAEVAAFLADRRPDAYERLVDRLLASPHYGERWARPWLDLGHYADTEGYLQDKVRPVAWRYRQWLIDALNRDLPFDQLTLRQIAGDLLPGATTDDRVGTGFLRGTLSNREGGADLEEYRVEQVVDRTTTVGTGWLGLTVGCARCHDHKFDPLSQREFFGLYALFDSADEVNIDAPLPDEQEAFGRKIDDYRRKREGLLRPVAKELAELQARWEKKLLEADADPSKDHVWARQWEVLGLIWGENFGEGQLEGCQIVRVGPARRTWLEQARLLDYFLEQGSLLDPKKFQDLKLAELSKKLKDLKQEVPWPTRAPTVRQTPVPRAVRLHVRGDFRVPGAAVEPGTPAVLPPLVRERERINRPNRLDLARWVVDPANPLPARVTVNRFWHEFFGRGLVRTTEDFGTRGEPPSHPELLDWLAAAFRDGGWGMKAAHRLIVTSATYRQSSRPRPELAARDPNNTLLARQASLRLSADQVRDAALAVSGLLSRKIGGPSVFPQQPASVSTEAFDHKWETSKGEDRYRRGMYTFLQRLSPFAQGVTFDAPSLSRSCTRRERSNTPLQALTLLNDPAFFEAAQSLAARVLRESRGDTAGRVDHLFRLCLARGPTAAERERLADYLQAQLAIVRRDPSSAGKLFPHKVEGVGTDEAAAWVGVCSVVLNLHEFITRD